MPRWDMAGRRLPMFPLGTVLFPHAVIPLHVFEPRYRALMQDCLDGDRRFGVVLIERGSEVGGGDQRAEVGTQGVITRAAELPDGRWVLEVTGEELVAIDEWLPDDPYPVALVTAHPGADRGCGVRGRARASGEPRTRRTKRSSSHCASRRPSESGGHGPCWPNTAERRPFRPDSSSTAGEVRVGLVAALRGGTDQHLRRATAPHGGERRHARLTRLVQPDGRPGARRRTDAHCRVGDPGPAHRRRRIY